MGEKVFIARQDTLEEVRADTITLKADTIQIKTDTTTLKADTTQIKADTTQIKKDTTQIKTDAAATKTDAKSILTRIGLTGDTGGSQAAGTVMGKENAILGILEKIYRTACFHDVTAVEAATITASATVPANTSKGRALVLKTETLTRDFYPRSITVSINMPNGNNYTATANMYATVNDTFFASGSAGANGSNGITSKTEMFHFNALLGGWLAKRANSGNDAENNVLGRPILLRKGTVLKIIDNSVFTNANGTASGNATASFSMTGYYIKI